MISDILKSWLKEPPEDDDGQSSPKKDIIEAALDWECDKWDTVIIDPNGGLLFERKLSYPCVEQTHFWDDGTIDYLFFSGTKLLQRVKLK